MTYYDKDSLCIRDMEPGDAAEFSAAFEGEGLAKGRQLFEHYLAQAAGGERQVFAALWQGRPAGYVTLVPQAEAGPFRGLDLPEIKDFNVLPSVRRRGIGGALLDAAEEAAKGLGRTVTLGVGLYGDYGAAQRMYARRGYIPDGSGLWHGDKPVAPGREVTVDDDLVLFLAKELATAPFEMRLCDVQPSQLYISRKKLEAVEARLNGEGGLACVPLTVKRMRGRVTFTDGHTRAFALYRAGVETVTVEWEPDDWDWELYDVCLDWCAREGVGSVADFEGRILDPGEYDRLWIDRCAGMQREIADRRKEK